MRKILILMILLICLTPATAFANAPAPDQYDSYLLIDDETGIKNILIWGYNQEDQLTDFDSSVIESTQPNERILKFRTVPECNSLKVVVFFSDGTTIQSNVVEIVDSGEYIYSAEDNILEVGKITTIKPVPFLKSFLGIILFPLALIIPLVFTVIIEWGISLLFKLKPGKYVAIINIITNISLNLILFFICVYNTMNYILALVLLEAFVMGIEFWFYTYKYKTHSKKRLLLFSIVANVTSWGLYSLFTLLIGL